MYETMAQKGTDAFKATIKEYLDGLAQRDEAFALSYEAPNKSLDECIDYIITQVRKIGANGYDDSEIYGMAVHYYDEENPGTITKGASAQCVVNHHIELTEAEIAEAKQKALDQITAEKVKKEKEREKREKEAARQKAEEAKKREQEEGSLFLWE